MTQDTVDLKRKAFNQIKKELDSVSAEMVALISQYALDVSTPLRVIPTAREKITDDKDYMRFLELSLQGRLLGESVEHLDNTSSY